jgi:RNA polymerase sigma-70 factor (ECF subfamily)
MKGDGMKANNLDAAEFLRLLLPVKKHLYNFIRKSLNFTADADDVYQETLLKAFKYFGSFDRNRSFKTWIFTTAHNLLRDHFRKTKRLPPLLEVGETTDCSVSNPAHPEELTADIYRLAGTLKPRQRAVFFLYYYNEFQLAEITRITGLSKANIKFMLHQARRAIRKILEVRE